MPTKPILLAEDDSNDVFIFWRYHKLCGVHNPLEVFSDGEDIISYFKSSRATCPLPALVFLDLKMPRMGGLEVLEFLSKSGYEQFSTVVLTGNGDSDLRAKVQQLGATSCLAKPVEKRQFCELMAGSESIQMEGCFDVPGPGNAPAQVLLGAGLHPMHAEIFGRKDAWPSARIAVIGRDDATRQALERLLRAAGLGARVYASAREFLASVQLEQTDCLLLNTSLPAMDCPDLAERLRAINIAVPIIVITNPSASGQLVNVASNSVVACLNSPVEWETLRQAISSALQRK